MFSEISITSSLYPLLGLLSLIVLIYWYSTRNFNYWSKQGINGPKPVPLLGNILDRLRYSMADTDVNYYKKYGSIYGIFNGTEPVLQIGEPELIKQVLVKDFHHFTNRRDLRTYHSILNKNLFNARDEDWKKIRKITSSTFTSGKMKKLYPLIKKCLNNYLKHLDKAAEEGRPLSIKAMHENFTLDVIACCAFATDTNALENPDNPFIVNGRKTFELSATLLIPGFIFPKYLNNLLNIKTILNHSATEWLIKLAKHIIQRRRLSNEKNVDFLQLLLDAKEDDLQKDDFNEGLESHYIIKDEESIKSETKDTNKMFLTEDEVVAQAWVFLLAGFETTATTLGYMSYELAKNPECQQKLYDEVVSAMNSDQEISYDDLHRLPYLDACISETLRLYPPVTRLEREVNENFKLGTDEIRLQKGQLVEILVYAVHHSDKYFKDPEKFIPERFLPENRQQIIPYTYMPFGTGPRNCIGMRFALMELKLAMANIIHRYNFVKCRETEDKLKFKPITPITAAQSVTVAIERRTE